METMNKKQIALTLGLVSFLIISGIFFVSNKSLKKDLTKEKIKSEALLSEKLALDKSIASFKNDLKTMKGKNSELDKKITEINQQLDKKQSEIKKLLAENASLNVLKTKVKELEALKNKLNDELYALQINYENLKFENLSANDQLTALKKEKEQLVITNTILAALAGNNYRIEAVRGKGDKLTVNARRAQKLVVTFDLPNDVSNNISFKLVTPEGTVFASDNNESALINITENSDNFYASIEEMDQKGTKRVELIYKPKEKLNKGVYEFEIYKETTYIGSTQLRLR